MHYVDEGDGLPVLLLHGNPTWSYLYRVVIRRVCTICRPIAPDYPGFGFSAAPEGYGFTPPEHASWLETLVDALGLDRFVLLAHDWGGPIGLSLATRRPERVAGLVLTNTWAWPVPPRVRLFSCLLGGRWMKRLHLRWNLFARFVVPLGIHRPEAREREVLDAYRRAFPTPASREPTWVFPHALRAFTPWLATLERSLGRLRDVPVELVWGTRDPALGTAATVDRGP